MIIILWNTKCTIRLKFDLIPEVCCLHHLKKHIQSNKMVPNKIFRFLIFFDVCGFNTGSSQISNNRKMLYFIYFVQILLAALITIYKFYLMIYHYPLLPLAAAMSLSLQFLVPLYAYWLIIFDSILYRRVHRQFWRTLQHIDKHFHDQSSFSCWLLIAKFIELFTATTLVISALMVINSNNFAQVRIVITSTFLIKICQVKLFYYIFCLEVVEFQLKMIEHELFVLKGVVNVEDARKYHPLLVAEISAFYTFLLRRLKWIRGYLHCVHKMINCLNEMFGFSHVAVIFFCYIFLLTDLTWCYDTFAFISRRILFYLTT